MTNICQEKLVKILGLGALLLVCSGTAAAGAPSAEESIAQYREMLQEDNPADLWQDKGEALWKVKRGPKQVSLESCDLGQGAGVVKGAYAQLPRYFADTGKVQDLESRLVTCMVTIQGMTKADAEKNHFSEDSQNSDIEALSAYVAAASKGITIAVPQSNPLERQAYAVGEQLFFYRAGPHDFACSTCHGTTGSRIRLQILANLSVPGEAQKVFATWPAYRVSQGTVRTMENRIYDCLRQQRMPEPDYGSDLMIDLTEYMGVQAKGGAMAAPSLKR
jgi:sulfur-oxidizing protein SoxA